MTDERPFVLAFFRRNAVRPLRRVLIMAIVILLIGCLIVAVSFLTHQPSERKIVAAVAGLALTVAGALTAIVGTHILLRDESYLAARSDGLMVSLRGQERLIAWDDVRAVRYDETRQAFVLECDGDQRVEFFDSTPNAKDMVKILDQLRRRAQLGLRM